MPLSYALITKLLRRLGRIVKRTLEVSTFFRPSSVKLIQLLLRLCKRFWSHLNPINRTSGNPPTHRQTDPTHRSNAANAHVPVYMSRLPYLQVQGATPLTSPSTESFQVGSPLVSPPGYTGAIELTSDISSEATTKDVGPLCTMAIHIPLPGDPIDAFPMNVDEDTAAVITDEPEPMPTADETPRTTKANSRRGERQRSVTFDPNLPPSPDPADPSANVRLRRSRRTPKVKPMTADEMMQRRYGRKGQADWKTSYSGKNIMPGQRDYRVPCEAGWVRHVQAEGAQYFYHPELRVLTDAPDIHNKCQLDEVQQAAKSLRQNARNMNIQLSDDTELVVELEPKRKKGYQWKYYFVDHAAHVVFWIHPVEYKYLVGHVRGVEQMSHLKYAAEAQYWMHREMFPLNRPIPLSVLKSLKATLIYAQAEEITSNMSLAPFDVDELGNLVDLVDRMEEGAQEGRPDIIFVIARLHRIFTEAKFVNFYGQVGARLNADQSVYSEEDHKPSHVLPVLDVFLFGAASTHLKMLKLIWVDRTVNYPRWKGYIGRLLAEWNSFTIYSTVMLAVDVSFLGNPGMQITSAVNSQQLAALISIYLSLVCVVGSLLVSVLLVGQARGQEGGSAKDAADFVKRMTQSVLGLEALAIMQSVPYALLIWGMLFFVMTVACLIFGSNETVIIAIISPAWVVVALLCLWPLVGGRQRGHHGASLHNVWRRMVKSLPPLCLPPLRLPFFKRKPPLPT